MTLKGEYGRMNDSFRQLAVGISLAIALVYLLQVTLFRSWIAPGVIMFSVPLGFIGVLWMLFLTRTTLNVQSLIGATFLIGIAVNNGVLLVDFANRRRKESGLSAKEAMREAAATRFRPILMTFFATVLAMAPMAMGLSRGGRGRHTARPGHCRRTFELDLPHAFPCACPLRPFDSPSPYRTAEARKGNPRIK